MRVGLISDVHANLAALQAVLHEAADAGVSELMVTGDLVGYYFWPRQVLEELRGWRCHVIRGNHEDLLAQMRRDPEAGVAIRRKYGSGLDVALAELGADELDGLDQLPATLSVTVGSTRFLLCHGAPWDTDEYVYPDAPEQTFARIAQADADVILLGHTHYPLVKPVGDRLIVNPGSVGQPRDGRPGAAWATFDLATRVVEPRLTAYDAGPVIEAARERNPELPYLERVLTRTRTP